MTKKDDEDDDDKVIGRPNAYFAALDRATAGSGFDGSYRGTRTAPGGTQRVHAGDTLGTLDRCWCGAPEGHDWPGKDKGSKHPKEQTVSAAAAEAPHISKAELPGFIEDVADVILRAVNDYGARYRLSRRGIMLYPPDGTAAYSISSNASDRDVKRIRRWFVTHCVPVEQAKHFVKDGDVLVDDMESRQAKRQVEEQAQQIERATVEELAKALNSPEHPVEETFADRVDAEIYPEPEQEVRSTEDDHEGWEPWVSRKHYDSQEVRTDENFVQRGEDEVKCLRCGWTGTRRGKSGHELAHDEERRTSLYSEENQEKKRVTIAERESARKVHAAVDLLNDVLGIKAADAKELEALKVQVEHLSENLRKAKVAYDRVADERDDLKARLDLVRETMRL